MDRGAYMEHEPQEDAALCDFNESEHKAQYVYVGPGRGHYEESLRGNFHYVGPHMGHFNKEVVQNNPSKRICCLCCCLLVVALVICVIVRMCTPEPLFNCQEGLGNWEAGWSEMKKEFCCENEGKGCIVQVAQEGEEGEQVMAGGGVPVAAQPPPRWLDLWMADLSIGSKFILSTVMALFLGWICGAMLIYKSWKHFVPETRCKTENEMLMEMRKLLKRSGAATSGEITVTLMWDTMDDLDLHLKLPGVWGEIHSECPEVGGGKLDTDGNKCRDEASTKAIENIAWPEYDHSHKAKLNPPLGEYTVTVRVWEKADLHHDANIFVVVTISGKREVFHHRIVAGMTELKICDFQYEGPAPR